MKYILTIIAVVLLFTSLASASVSVKYGSCTGSCYCASNMIENYNTSEALMVVEIPNKPELKQFDNRFSATYDPELKKILFNATGDTYTVAFPDLAYPINKPGDNSYGVPQCVYVINSYVKDNCLYNVFCNDESSGSSSLLPFIAAITFSVVLSLLL
ncbi:hypothetical protein PPL_11604 [Heterostelium album PN500]|uniref:Uncharacterized protein n=1 Tax=Heterostelium pallidum (strain ATCC 26659 / Pp 5 / PN500) TaxID=670386 RepID=D3BV79_HETP5|nr:hypothetical protein PPL_11604 [Heterostelium album PN500]EFA74636.1 hypothetical protein PPL_11604 [Heterostelium album PN500]|eukprot:XP_020426770.1 hypothetical protein PPL_11604 [Heterostelium album PN500]